jgi:glutamyl-tRNA reductase
MQIYHARHVITEYRNRLEKIRAEAQEKAIRQLQKGIDPQIVLEQFGADLMNKVMHHPTVKLREAAAEEKCGAFMQLKQFFELE